MSQYIEISEGESLTYEQYMFLVRALHEEDEEHGNEDYDDSDESPTEIASEDGSPEEEASSEDGYLSEDDIDKIVFYYRLTMDMSPWE